MRKLTCPLGKWLYGVLKSCDIYSISFSSAQVEEFVRKETASSRVWQLPEAELAAYAHYVQSVTLGGELIASITITNPKTVEYR